MTTVFFKIYAIFPVSYSKTYRKITFFHFSNIFLKFSAILSRFSRNFSTNFKKLLREFFEIFLKLYVHRILPKIFLQFFKISLKIITQNFYRNM